ncbi:MAG: pilin [Woeseiaceae bacterium]|nr:pilin [Woeseiaceae bacterium]
MGAGAKAPVIDAFNMNGEPPADRAAAGLSVAPTDTKGRYVSQVDIFEGRVDVTMGGRVHAEVFGDTISFTPYLSPSGGIVWRCGAASPPAGTVLLSGGGVTSAYLAPTIELRYLPSSCRN